ncbi:hypothetical protein FKM82_019188 [Ascaphus truei]
MTGIRIQVVCMMLLVFTSCGTCTDSEEEIKALEADLLSNIYSSKQVGLVDHALDQGNSTPVLKPPQQVSKARLPYWKMALLNVCGLINNINTQAEETGETGEEEIIIRKQYPTSMDGFNLEAMLTIFQLQKICHSRGFQHWELLQQDYLDPNSSKNEKEDIMKRKTPYILKRQTHVSKARRPYILKRGSYY